jgi:hypothetical protein
VVGHVYLLLRVFTPLKVGSSKSTRSISCFRGNDNHRGLKAFNHIGAQRETPTGGVSKCFLYRFGNGAC